MAKRSTNTEKWTEELSRLECQRRGWDFEPVGHWWYDGRVRRRRDMFGFADGLAVVLPERRVASTGRQFLPGQEILLQYTSASNVSARLKKVRAHENLPRVRGWGWEVVVWGWRDDGRLREEWIE